MKRNFKYLLPLLLIFSLFFLIGCLSPFFDPIQGAIKGRIMVPSSSSKNITGWVPLPNAVVTLTDSEGNTHTVNTNSNGYYTIFNVAPGTNYILTATGEVEGNMVILKDFIPQVEAGKTYNAGTADCESTALALVAEALLTEGLIPEDIDPEQIQNTDNFPNLVSQVCLLLEQNADVTSNPTINSQIEDVIGEILPSETPPPPSPSPSPSPILSSNANLSNLLISTGTLNPNFSLTITDYTVTVAYSVDTITFTPTAAHDKATITVKGESVASGQPSSSISLSVGDNSIPIIVTAEDSTTKTYTVIVIRNSPPSDNANLSKLDIKYIGGVVSERNIEDPIYPTFDSATTPYILHLVGTSSNIEVVATTEDPSASAIVLYNEGLCVYSIQVTAEDGTTQNNYAIQAHFYNSIKAALEVNRPLADGHMVTVVPGIYQEGSTIDFPDKQIRLQSIDPEDSLVREKTVIDGNSGYRVFSFAFDTLSNLGSGTNLTGFTIQNGSIQNGSTSDDEGGGIYIDNGIPTIAYNTISGNTSYDDGGGIYMRDSSPTITNNTISGNICGDDGGGIHIDNGTPDITNNTISGNFCTNDGGGIYMRDSSPTITNNTISENICDDGGGIYIANGTPNITNNTISGNTSYDDGGGIHIANGTPNITNNTISGNTGYFDGGGIYIYGGTPTIGGSDGSDTGNFNTICGNILYPDSPNQGITLTDYPNNYICDSCVGCGP